MGKVFNCGTGEPQRIDTLARLIAMLHRREDLVPELQPARPGDIKDSYADISLARKILGYRPQVSLEDGLREIIDSKMSSGQESVSGQEPGQGISIDKWALAHRRRSRARLARNRDGSVERLRDIHEQTQIAVRSRVVAIGVKQELDLQIRPGNVRLQLDLFLPGQVLYH